MANPPDPTEHFIQRDTDVLREKLQREQDMGSMKASPDASVEPCRHQSVEARAACDRCDIRDVLIDCMTSFSINGKNARQAASLILSVESGLSVKLSLIESVDNQRLAQIREMDEYEILDLLDRTAAQAEAALNHQIAGEHSRLAAADALIAQTIVRAKAAEHAHEFAQQQHVKTFANLCEVERIARREDYTAVYDLLTDLRTALDDATVTADDCDHGGGPATRCNYCESELS